MNRIAPLCLATLLLALIPVATPLASSAQTFESLLSFDGSNGSRPEMVTLAQGPDGNLYGTTSLGGAHDQGTAFRVTPQSDSLTTLHSFCGGNCSDGMSPTQGVILATDGNFYGVTGTTAYRMTPQGVVTTLYTFCSQACNGGFIPYGALVQGVDGNLYGTTNLGGGSTNCSEGCGTVFKLSLAGQLTMLHSFDSTDGANPQGPLVQGLNGSFYGTASFGGNAACDCGTVFEITPQGKLTTLHEFSGSDGALPESGLILANDGNFYGTTIQGGSAQAGTVFKLTPQGSLTTLYNFTNGSDGASPTGLVQGTDENFYGAALAGPHSGCSAGCGTIFTITASGNLTTLFRFSGSNGMKPFGGLAQATSGVFYGTTYQGGDEESCQPPNGCGTIYSLDMGLGPFVSFVLDGGKAGTPVAILGQGFSGATSVSFNGTEAKFSVLSDTAMRATVPAGATTGYLTVATSSGTLKSNRPFVIIP